MRPLSAADLDARAAALCARLAACTLCARRCGADRVHGIARAACRIGRWAKVHSWGAWGIRFAGCNLRCLACPTAEAAWDGQGDEQAAGPLAEIMLAVQRSGAGELRLIRPSHVAAQVVEALAVAVRRGLVLPVVWDSGGFDAVDTVVLLDGVVASYVVEAKHGDSAVARQCCGVSGYAETNAAVVAEMHRQVGDALVVRHRVLPHGLAGTAQLAARLPPGVRVELAADHCPVHRAGRHPKLNRAVTAEEVAAARRDLAAGGIACISPIPHLPL